MDTYFNVTFYKLGRVDHIDGSINAHLMQVNAP
jgi:hypothetical protein